MNQFPHTYTVAASAQTEGDVALESDGLPSIASAPPTEFGGPGDKWSPEDLIVAAVADCFVLSFRAVAAASKLEWNELKCSVVGTLDRVERDVKFTEMKISAALSVPEGVDQGRAQRSLEKAEKMCFITNSLNSEVHLEFTISNG